MVEGGIISLPWPDRDLHPNARVHFRPLAAAKKLARNDAYWLAKKAGIHPPAEGRIILVVSFFWPDNRPRDLDGAFASLKAHFDGIADALGVNDRRFDFILNREDPEPPGRVTVKVCWRGEA